MGSRTYVVLVVAWISSLFVVGTLASAQSYGFRRLPDPITLTGSDLAFRVEGHVGREPAGTLMIRWEGRWVEARGVPNRLRLLGETDSSR
jgi:hypothetical protein